MWFGLLSTRLKSLTLITAVCASFMHDGSSCCTCVEVSLVESVVAVMAFVGFDVVVVVIVVVALVEFGAPGDTRRT